MAALATEQLECLLDCILPYSTRVLGVFPADCVPMRVVSVNPLIIQSNVATSMERHPQLDVNQGYTFIMNTDPASAPGEHWLAFFYNGRTHKLEYFDSFGFPLSMYAHVNASFSACNLTNIMVRVNQSHMLQALTSTVCGHYCAAFIQWRARHKHSNVGGFTKQLMSTHSTSLGRDTYIVKRLRTITSMHPCCSSLLSGYSTSQPHVSRFSQSCCCRSRCMHA
jgi:hypothetical protein